MREHKPAGKVELNGRLVEPVSILSTYLLTEALNRTWNHAGGKVIDIGCGDMPYKGLFSHENFWGFDWPSSQKRLVLDVFADAHRIPLANVSINTVICTELLEHVREPRQVLSEISRVLVPGGIAILSVPFVHPHHELPHDYYRFTKNGLEMILHESKFEMLEYYPRGGIGLIIFDLGIRWINIMIKRISKRLRFGRGFERLMQLALIDLPQRVIVWLLSNLGDRIFELHFFSTSKQLTLGHVAVARKTS